MTPSQDAHEAAMVTIKDHIEMVTNLSILIPSTAVVDYVNAITRVETRAPILDPTWFARSGHNIDGHRRLARAFLEFRRELDSILAAEGGL